MPATDSQEGTGRGEAAEAMRRATLEPAIDVISVGQYSGTLL